METQKSSTLSENRIEPAEIRRLFNQAYFDIFTDNIHIGIEYMLRTLGKTGYNSKTTIYRDLPFSTLDSDTTPDERKSNYEISESIRISNEEWKSIKEIANTFPRTGLQTLEYKRQDCDKVLHILFYDEKEYIDELMDEICHDNNTSGHLLTMFSDDWENLSTKQITLISKYLQMACKDYSFENGEVELVDCFDKLKSDIEEILTETMEMLIEDISEYPFHMKYGDKDWSDYSINISSGLTKHTTMRVFCLRYEDLNTELNAMTKSMNLTVVKILK